MDVAAVIAVETSNRENQILLADEEVFGDLRLQNPRALTLSQSARQRI